MNLVFRNEHGFGMRDDSNILAWGGDVVGCNNSLYFSYVAISYIGIILRKWFIFSENVINIVLKVNRGKKGNQPHFFTIMNYLNKLW